VSAAEHVRRWVRPGDRVLEAATTQQLDGGHGDVHHVVLEALTGDPAPILERARDRLAPGGMVHATAANPRSLGRLISGAADTAEGLDADALADAGRRAGLVCVHRESLGLDLDGVAAPALDRLARYVPGLGAVSYAIFVLDA
jgi:hypothetical protein